MKDSKSGISAQDKLAIVLEEYKTLRSEIIKCSDRQLYLFYILVAVLCATYAYTMAHAAFDILCLIPLLASPFIFRYIWEQQNVQLIGKYMKEEIEEKRIPSIAGYRCEECSDNYDRYWIAWQHYWDDVAFKRMKKYGFYSKHWALLLIILISFVPSIAYSVLFSTSRHVGLDIQSSMPILLHIAALTAYILLGLWLLKDLRRLS